MKPCSFVAVSPASQNRCNERCDSQYPAKEPTQGDGYFHCCLEGYTAKKINNEFKCYQD
jgi:hypothetical protein